MSNMNPRRWPRGFSPGWYEAQPGRVHTIDSLRDGIEPDGATKVGHADIVKRQIKLKFDQSEIGRDELLVVIREKDTCPFALEDVLAEDRYPG